MFGMGISKKARKVRELRAAGTLKAASTDIIKTVSQEVTSFPEEEFDVHEN
jgi:hypothetical protein